MCTIKITKEKEVYSVSVSLTQKSKYVVNQIFIKKCITSTEMEALKQAAILAQYYKDNDGNLATILK